MRKNILFALKLFLIVIVFYPSLAYPKNSDENELTAFKKRYKVQDNDPVLNKAARDIYDKDLNALTLNELRNLIANLGPVGDVMVPGIPKTNVVIITLDDGSKFMGEVISNDIKGYKIKVDGGYITVGGLNTGFKIQKIEKKSESIEISRLMIFKGSGYDVTFNASGNYSSPLTAFEIEVGKRVQQLLDKDISPEDDGIDCIRQAAKEFNLPPFVIDEVFMKAGLISPGAVLNSPSNSISDTDAPLENKAN